MNYRKLGASELVVSEIAFGSWLTFSSGASRKNAIACVHRALDRGITLFDTANVYGLGKAEKVMGEALHGVPRDRYVLATKLFFPMSDIDRGLSCQQVHKQIDASLDRLQVSYVDLYQCHRYDERTPLEETMRALTQVVQAGKARYIGFSEWPVDRIEAALAIPGVEKFVSSQPQYSLLHRDPERALLPLCERSGISQIVWSPLAQGLLTGKYVPGAPLPASCRAADLSLKGFINTNWFKPKMLQAIQNLKPLAAEAGLTLAQFALAWVLRQSNVAAAIIGASRPEQIDENVAASGHALSPELARRAEALIAAAS
jgi:aryl-alcohol dehydrogenase-like predicted oxidoreductase